MGGVGRGGRERSAFKEGVGGMKWWKRWGKHCVSRNCKSGWEGAEAGRAGRAGGRDGAGVCGGGGRRKWGLAGRAGGVGVWGA